MQKNIVFKPKSIITLFSIMLCTSSFGETFFAYKSNSQDSLGKGTSGVIRETDSQRFKFSGQPGFIDFNTAFNDFEHNWNIFFGSPRIEKLEVGRVYIANHAMPNEISAGISASFSSAGCSGDANTPAQFKILEMDYDSKNQMRFAADFVMSCPFGVVPNQKPTLFGAIRYNSSIPNDLDDYIKSLDEKTTAVVQDNNRNVRTEYSSNDKAYEIITNDNVIRINNDSEALDLSFAAAGKNPLIEGFYNNAKRYPFQTPDVPGMEIFVNNTGCNILTGKFKVLQAQYDESHNIKKLAIDYAMHCDKESVGAPSSGTLTGAIRYHSASPINIDLPGKLNANELDLPYVQIDEKFYRVKLSVEKQEPLSLKVTYIGPTEIKEDDVRVSSYFNNNFENKLIAPQIELTDVLGKKHIIENMEFQASGPELKVGDILTSTATSQVNLKLPKTLKKI
jgi:hypothetical protein